MLFDEPNIKENEGPKEITSLRLPIESLSVLGHESNQRALLDAWNLDKLHHAWLFTGQKGIGKASLAYQFARFVLANGSPQSDGLFGPTTFETLEIKENHPVYKRMLSGGHSDFFVLEKGMLNPDTKKIAENDIPIAIVRKSLEFIRLTPAESEWRVILIDAADNLNRNAANALLKALEEPPAKALFLLISHSPGKLLPTIKSRCRQLTFKPLSDDTVIELIEKQYPDLNEEDSHALARLAEGSIGHAIRIQENNGLDLFKIIISLLSRPSGISLTKLHGLAEQLSRKDAKESFYIFREMLDWWLKRLIKIIAGDHMPKPIFAEEYMAIEACKNLMPLGKWLEAADFLNQRLSQNEAPVNLDTKQVIIDAFLTLETMAQQR